MKLCLVPGTHDATVDDAGRWWTPPSPWADYIATLGHEILDRERPFVWSGDLNGIFGKTSDWRTGGRNLYDYLVPPRCPDRRVPPEETVVVTHCFDESVEMLTPDGWRGVDEVASLSRVLTLNRHTGRSEWNVVQKVHVGRNTDDLVRVKSSKLDLLMTQDHRCWVGVQRRRKTEWVEKPAKALLKNNHQWLHAAETSQEQDYPVDDCWLRLVAWVVAEGCFTWRMASEGKGKKGPKRKTLACVRISQSDAPGGRMDRLLETLNACGIPHSRTKRYDAGETQHGTHRNWDAYNIGLKDIGTWRDVLLSYIREDKFPNFSFADLSLRQAKLFIEAYVDGDGCRTGKHAFQVSTNREDFADWFQGLCVLAGLRSSKTSRSKETKTGPKPLWTISFNTNPVTHTAHRNVRLQKYSGRVWCVTVPNDTVLVRSKGRTVFTMNSHGLQVALYAASYGLKIAKLIDICGPVRRDMPQAARANIADWTHVRADHEDWWQWLGSIGDGHVGAYRDHPWADRNVTVPGAGHSGLVRDPAFFHHWKEWL